MYMTSNIRPNILEKAIRSITGKLNNSWRSHLASGAAFIIGIFSPLTMSIILSVLLCGFIAYENIKLDKQQTVIDNITSIFKVAKVLLGALWIQTTKNYTHEEDALLNLASSFNQLDDYYIGIFSITIGAAVGIICGLISMITPLYIAIPLSITLLFSMLFTVCAGINDIIQTQIGTSQEANSASLLNLDRFLQGYYYPSLNKGDSNNTFDSGNKIK